MATRKALSLDWDAQDFHPVRPGVLGATITTDQLTVTLYQYEPGSSWETHEHPEDQVTIVVGGGPITFICGGEEVVLSLGETAVIPGGIPHSARLGAEGARTVNVFPPRGHRP